jgi:hypothetical protein
MQRSRLRERHDSVDQTSILGTEPNGLCPEIGDLRAKRSDRLPVSKQTHLDRRI